MTHGGGLTISQNVSSQALTVWDRQWLEDSEQKDHSMNEWINHKGVYKTAPATPAKAFRSAQNFQKKWFSNGFWKSNLGGGGVTDIVTKKILKSQTHRKLNFAKMFTPPSHVTCDTSHVICRMSHVTCHMSKVFFFLYFSFDKEVELCSGGSVINGAYTRLVYLHAIRKLTHILTPPCILFIQLCPIITPLLQSKSTFKLKWA